MVCGDLDPHGIADPLINFGQVFNGNGHHVGFCGLHLIAFLVSGGDCPGSLLIVYKTVHKRMDTICIWLLRREIQSIKNGLDAGIVKAFSIFALTVDLYDHFIQLGKAVPHILNVSPVFRCGAGGNGAAVEAQLHGGHIVLRGTGKDGTEQNHQHDQRGKDGHNDPANLFAGLLIGKDCDSCLGDGSNSRCAHAATSLPSASGAEQRLLVGWGVDFQQISLVATLE